MADTKNPFELSFEKAYSGTLFGGPSGRQTRTGPQPPADTKVQFIKNHSKVIHEKVGIIECLLRDIAKTDPELSKKARVEVAAQFANALDLLGNGLELPQEVRPESEEEPTTTKRTTRRKKVEE